MIFHNGGEPVRHATGLDECKIESVKNIDNSLVEMDYKTSENKIGEIVNLSQKLNSIIWDRLNSNDSFESIKEVYEDVCKLAVLSGIEIDKAKRKRKREIIKADIKKRQKERAIKRSKGEL